MDIEAAEDLNTLFGPEVYAHCELQVYPVMPLQAGAELFQQWAMAGR